VHKRNKQKTADVLSSIESAGVPCCFFEHSKDAILHSRKIGLLSDNDLLESQSVQTTALKSIK
jgi:hypothetical protein